MIFLWYFCERSPAELNKWWYFSILKLVCISLAFVGLLRFVFTFVMIFNCVDLRVFLLFLLLDLSDSV